MKTKLKIEDFGIFEYKGHFCISIGKNYYNPHTARRDINIITQLLFKQDRYTPKMLKALEDKSFP